MNETTAAPVSFTYGAIQELKRLATENGTNLQPYVRVGVKGGGCSGMTYVLEYDSKTDQDIEFNFDGINVVINPAHEMYLVGMEIQFEGGLNSRGFTFQNPNASSTCGCGTSFAV